jgi:hypothetical protein
MLLALYFLGIYLTIGIWPLNAHIMKKSCWKAQRHLWMIWSKFRDYVLLRMDSRLDIFM